MATVKIELNGWVMQDRDTKTFNYSFIETPYEWQSFVGPISLSTNFTIPEDYHPVKAAIKEVDRRLDAAAEAYYKMKAKLEGDKQDLLAIGFDAPIEVPVPDEL